MSRSSLEGGLDSQTILDDVKRTLESISQKYDFSNIPVNHIDTLKEHVLRFLHSNSVSTVEDLNNAPKWLKIAVGEQFFYRKNNSIFSGLERNSVFSPVVGKP